MADPLVMLDEEDVKQVIDNERLITIVLPEDFEIEGNILRLSRKYILKLAATMLIQVDLDDD